MERWKKALLVAGMILTMATGTTAMAAGTNYTAVSGGSMSFSKYLVMDQQAEVPNASFTYAVTAGSAVAAYNGTFEVLAGVNPQNVTMAGVGSTTAAVNTIVFNQGDGVKTDANAYIKDYDPATEKYVEKVATLDFSGCGFTEPGVYRYVLTESGSNLGVINDADNTRIIDVYVEDTSANGTKTLAVTKYVMHADASNVNAGADMGTDGTNPAGKDQGFTNTYVTSDLAVKKEVAGNQASHDKYFAITVTLTGAVANTVYNVDLTAADPVSGNNDATIAVNAWQTNPSEMTTNAQGSATAVFYLQHGQSVKIQGIAAGTQYAVTENAEDYKSKAAAVTGYTDPVSGAVEEKDLNTSYKNTRAGLIPTGIVMSVAPFAAVTLLGGAGVVRLTMKKRREDDED